MWAYLPIKLLRMQKANMTVFYAACPETWDLFYTPTLGDDHG